MLSRAEVEFTGAARRPADYEDGGACGPPANNNAASIKETSVFPALTAAARDFSGRMTF